MWPYLKISDKLTRHSRVPRLIFKLIELWWIFWPCRGQNNKQTNLSGKYNKYDQITINKLNYKTLPSWKGERKVNQMVIYHYKFLKINGSTNWMAKTCKGLKNVLRHFRVFFPCKLVESTYLCLFSAQKQTTNTLCRFLWWKEFMSCVWIGYSNYWNMKHDVGQVWAQGRF